MLYLLLYSFSVLLQIYPTTYSSRNESINLFIYCMIICTYFLLTVLTERVLPLHDIILNKPIQKKFKGPNQIRQVCFVITQFY